MTYGDIYQPPSVLRRVAPRSSREGSRVGHYVNSWCPRPQLVRYTTMAVISEERTIVVCNRNVLGKEGLFLVLVLHLKLGEKWDLALDLQRSN